MWLWRRCQRRRSPLVDLHGEPLLRWDEMKIVGAHNPGQCPCGHGAVRCGGHSPRGPLTVLRRLKALPTVPASCREVKRGALINDSKATNGDPGRRWPGCVKVRGRLLARPVVRARQDFGPIQALLGQHQIDHMYCFGQDAEVLLALGEQTERVADLPPPSPSGGRRQAR